LPRIPRRFVADLPGAAVQTPLTPLVARLAFAGITANQVTIASLIGSIAVGAFLVSYGERPIVFALLPIWLLARMSLATIDGTLAVDFGQKSRLGGMLNEVGDVLSDIALFLALAFVAPFSPTFLAVVIALSVLCEIAGIAGPALGGSRRLDGPFGKADRTLALGAIGAWFACRITALERRCGAADLRDPALRHHREPAALCCSRGPRCDLRSQGDER
jgi:CDP-diacylglycerol--glycerol-3-phosphate 3-phosphatidyltransferase